MAYGLPPTPKADVEASRHRGTCLIMSCCWIKKKISLLQSVSDLCCKYYAVTIMLLVFVDGHLMINQMGQIVATSGPKGGSEENALPTVSLIWFWRFKEIILYIYN